MKYLIYLSIIPSLVYFSQLLDDEKLKDIYELIEDKNEM